MDKMIKNIHPGEILRMELMEGRKLTIVKIAELLLTSRSNMYNIINGKSSITPNMALKLEKVFGSSAHFLNLQINYDLFKAKEKLKRA